MCTPFLVLCFHLTCSVFLNAGRLGMLVDVCNICRIYVTVFVGNVSSWLIPKTCIVNRASLRASSNQDKIGRFWPLADWLVHRFGNSPSMLCLFSPSRRGVVHRYRQQLPRERAGHLQKSGSGNGTEDGELFKMASRWVCVSHSPLHVLH